MTQYRIIRLPAVLARVGMSRSSIYAAISQKTFPSPIPLGIRCVGWLESDIDAWLLARVDAARSARQTEW